MTESIIPVEQTAERTPGKSEGRSVNSWLFITNRGPEIVAIVGGIVAWELIGRFLNFSFFPPISAVVRAWVEIYQTGELISELLLSLRSLAIGYSAAVVAGLALGTLMGRFRKVQYFFDPLIDINLSTPTLVYVPILFAFFGVGDMTRFVIVFTYSFFIIVVNTVAGIHNVDQSLVEMGRSFGASEGQLFRRIMLPNALPLIMAGLRIGMSRAVKGMINGELFIALVGLGARLRHYGGSFNSEKVLAILLTIIVVAMLMTSIVQNIDRRITGWAETVQAG